MRSPQIPLLLILSFFVATLLSAETETVKILGVGNSFTRNSTKYLPEIYANSSAQADIGAAIIGGCSLERHVKHLKEHEADPETGKEYGYLFNGESVEKRKFALKEILLAEDWDYITIQQVSTSSYKEETFYPYAQELIEYIRQYRPQAEIVIHETWSHSVNSFRNKEWGLDPDEMYAKLHANYAKIGDEFGLRIIPVGTASQNARATEMWDLPENDFDPKNHDLTYPEDKHNLPDMSKSLNYDYSWKKQGDEWVVNNDGYHANVSGEYLGGLVWYEFFTGNDAREISFKPNGLSDEQAESLRNIANQTVQSQKAAAAN